MYMLNAWLIVYLFYFQGAHVTVTARSEDDLDYDTVLEKVKNSSGSNYSFHKEKPKPAEKIKPVVRCMEI